MSAEKLILNRLLSNESESPPIPPILIKVLCNGNFHQNNQTVEHNGGYLYPATGQTVIVPGTKPYALHDK